MRSQSQMPLTAGPAQGGQTRLLTRLPARRSGCRPLQPRCSRWRPLCMLTRLPSAFMPESACQCAAASFANRQVPDTCACQDTSASGRQTPTPRQHGPACQHAAALLRWLASLPFA